MGVGRGLGARREDLEFGWSRDDASPSYAALRNDLIAHAGRILDSEFWAEDVVQTVLARWWEKSGAKKGQAAGFEALRERMQDARPFLRVAVARAALNVKAREAYRDTTGELFGHHQMAHWSVEPGPERALECRRAATVLHQAVEHLSKGERDAWRLVRLSEYTYREAGNQLGCSEGAVAQRLKRADHRLKVWLGRVGLSSLDDVRQQAGTKPR